MKDPTGIQKCNKTEDLQNKNNNFDNHGNIIDFLERFDL